MKIFNKKKLFFLSLTLLFFSSFLLEFNSASAGPMCDRYNEYRQDFSNAKSKKEYYRVKYIKKKYPRLYKKYNKFYNLHAADSKEQRESMSQSDQEIFSQYRSYKGFKKLDEYNKKCAKERKREKKSGKTTAETFSLTYSAGSGGRVDGTTSQTVNSGTSGSAVTATADTGYHFVNWSDTFSGNPRTEMNVLGNIAVTANFSINTYSLAYTASAGGAIVGTSTQTVNYGSSGSNVVATPNTGYHFVNWSDGGSNATRNETNVTADFSVNANFAINTYTLTYAAGANGSITGTSPQTVNYGASGSAVTAVPDVGYHFVRWSDNNTNASRTDSNVSNNISVSAVFESDSEIETYTLTYAAGAHGSITGTSPQTVNEGADGSEVTAVPDTGYHFTSWSDSSTENPRTDEDVAGDITVTASFAINTYTVTFDGNSSDGGSTATQTLTYNTPTNLTANGYTKTGYTFAGWATTAEGSVAYADTTSYTIGAANVTLYAKWTINTYTVTFDKNGGTTDADPTTKTANHGGNVGTLPTAPTRTNYTFSSWNTASNGSGTTFTATTAVTANLTVYAQWTINSYTLTYTAGSGGTITGTSPQTVNHGSSGSQVTAVADSGYHFTSWSDSVLTAARTDTNVTGNITVTASFEADAPTTYTVTFDGNSSDGGSTATQTLTYNTPTNLTANGYTKTGYTFAGWATTAEGSVAYADTTSYTIGAANVTLYAKWTINTYTVTFEKNGGTTDADPTTKTANHGGNVGTLPTAPTRTNYTFSSWNTASNGSGTSFTATTAVTANTTVYAQWTINSYTLTYTAGSGGTITGTSPQTVNAGSNGTEVTAVPDTGRHFVKWSDDVMTASRTDTNVSGNISVTAEFAINTYTLTYTASTGGTISGTTPQTVNYGASGSAVTAVPNSGYHFLEWSDHITTAARTDSNIVANLSVSAVFAENSVVTVSAINPASGYNTNSVDLTSITGTGFLAGATVKLTKTGQSDVPCNGFTIAENGESITGGACHIAGATAGAWNVVVTNTDTGNGALTDGFTAQGYEIATTTTPNGPAGGYIFYINPNYVADGWRYLEAAPSDYYDSANDKFIFRWWNVNNVLMGASGTAKGTGLSNTNTIVGSTSPDNSSAVGIAYNYSLGGYTDWFLPSRDELGEMYSKLYAINGNPGGFLSSGYWSSSESDNSEPSKPPETYSFRQSFSVSTPTIYAKTQTYRARPVRRFNNAYRITYDGNGNTGGTAPVDSNNHPAGSAVSTSSKGTLVKNEYKFMGWNTAADGSGTHYDAGANITIRGYVTLYAEWEVDFYVAIFPDTQSSVNWKRAVVTSQVDWLINNKDILDIRFVGHVGDLVAEWENDLTEWSFIQDEMNQLKTAGINYSILPGNHDYAQMTRNSTLLNSYFPLSNFSSGMSSYGGAYEAGKVDNTYHILNVGGKKLLIMSLEFGPRDAVVTWADGILKANSNTKAIIITHAYINTENELLADNMNHAASNGYNLADVNDGDELWDDLIYPNNNVAFVICGHDGTSTDGSGLKESTHANGAPVHQFLTNYQYYSPVEDGSYLFLLHFARDMVNKRDTVEVRTYSPYLNAYKTDAESQVDYSSWSF